MKCLYLLHGVTLKTDLMSRSSSGSVSATIVCTPIEYSLMSHVKCSRKGNGGKREGKGVAKERGGEK